MRVCEESGLGVLHESNVNDEFLTPVMCFCNGVWFNTSNFPKTEVGSEKFRTPVQTLENLEMKKTLVAIAALAAATGAFAQSSVTLSGQVQVGLYNAIDPAKKTTIDELGGSRTFLQFAANEDLGGGLKAGFKAQARFSPVNGQSKYTATSTITGTGTGTPTAATYAGGADTVNIFEQTVASIGGNYGTLNAGRWTNALGAAQGWVSPFGDDGALSARAATEFARQSGQVSYTTPTFYGFALDVLSARKDQLTIDQNGKFYTSPTTNINVNTLTYVEGPVKAFYAGVQNAYAQHNAQYGVNYAIGPVNLMASQNKDKDGLVNYKSGGTNDTLTSIAGTYTIGQYGIGLATVKSKVTSYKVTSLSGEYNMSKRTKLMAQLSDAKYNAATPAKIGTGSYFGISHAF